jgi:ABC-type transporter Mla subunit MlaD
MTMTSSRQAHPGRSWLANLLSFGEDRPMPRKLFVQVGVVGAAMTLGVGCGAKEQLRPHPRPDASPGYDVTALFPARSGLGVGARVTVDGATVGRVTAVEPQGSRMIATLRIRSRYAPLDVDTKASVHRASPATGRAYVVLVPGHHGSPLADQTRLPGAG